MLDELDEDELALAWECARMSAYSFRRSVFHDDLVSAGLEAAVRAKAKFEDRGIPFAHMLSVYVRNAVVSEHRRLTSSRGADTWRVGSAASVETLYPSQHPTTDDGTDAVLASLLVEQAKCHFTKRQRYCIEERFFRGRAVTDIAAELGVSISAVSKSQESAFRNARIAIGASC